MGRNRGGYTIIEVMLVIAITGLLFLSALVLVNGQQGDTQFSQAMQDLSSKMQNYVTQIKASSYPGIEGYSCNVSVTTTRPVLSTPAGGTPAGCVFLGRVFEVQPNTTNSNIIHSYIVIGTRDIYSGTTDTGTLATSVDQANPEPALNGSGTYLLVDDYTLGNGATVKSSKVTLVGQSSPSGSEYDLVGLYSQLDGGGTNGGTSLALSMRGYPYPGQSYPNQAVPQLKNCIEGQSATPLCAYTGGSANIANLSQWLLCVTSGSSSSTTAVVEVDSNASGVTAKYNVKAC